MRITRASVGLIWLGFGTSALGGTLHRVDHSAGGANDGSSWANAFVDLQSALAIAHSGDEIWVAQGVYKPTADLDRDRAFLLPAGVALYGGFAGDENARSERDWIAHETTLSGDLGQPGEGWGNASDNSRNVLRVTAGDATTRVDGFTIRGSGDGAGLRVEGGNPRFANLLITRNFNWNRGGGVNLLAGATPLFQQVEFRANCAAYAGGALATDVTSSPSFEDVLFVGNEAGVSGGAVSGSGSYLRVRFVDNESIDFGGAIAGGGSFVEVQFENNRTISGPGGAVGGSGSFRNVFFVGNRATGSLGSGGALYTTAGSTLRECFFHDNLSSVSGGAIADSRGGSQLANLIFVGNRSGWGGAYALGPQPTQVPPTAQTSPSLVVHSTFVGNYAEAAGGAIYNRLSTLALANSIVWMQAQPPQAQLFQSDGSTSIAHCLIAGSGASGAGWDPALGVDLGGNLDRAPQFVDAPAQNLKLHHQSPAIDAGHAGYVLPGLDRDFAGNPRVVGLAVDLGAFEWQGEVAQPRRSFGSLRALFDPD